MRVDQTEIESEFNQAYDDAWIVYQTWFLEAEKDLNFYLGKQWDDAEKQYLHSQKRNVLTVNQIRPAIDMITGYQRKHRLSSIFSPQSDRDQELADQLTKLNLYAFQNGNLYNAISDAFENALITGASYLHVYPDYSTDPVNGDIKVSLECHNSIVRDPFSIKSDLSDCSYVIRRRYLSQRDLKIMLPKKSRMIAEMDPGGYSDEKFIMMAQRRSKDMFAVDEYWKQEAFPAKMIIDKETGETEIWVDNFDRIDEYLEVSGIDAYVKNWKMPGVSQNLFVNGKWIASYKNPNGITQLPFVAFYGINKPQSPDYNLRQQGLVRQMRDSQREANRRRSQVMDLFESQISYDFIAEKGAASDIDQLYQSGQKKVVIANPGKISLIQRLNPPGIPPTLLELSKLCDLDMLSVAGCNEAMMGLDDNHQSSGVATLLRQGAGLIKLQGFFDNLRQSQKLLTQRVLELIQTWTPTKLSYLLEQEPVDGIFKPNLGLDVVIQEGVLTEHQRQLHYQQLLELKAQGLPVSGADLLRAAPIQGSRELLQRVEAQEKALAESQQKEALVEQENRKNAAQYLAAQEVSELASAREKMTKALSNLGLEEERVTQSLDNKEKALIDRLKAVKELETIDTKRLSHLLRAVELLKAADLEKQKKTELEDAEILKSIGENVSEQDLIKSQPIEQQQMAQQEQMPSQMQQEPSQLQEPADTMPQMQDQQGI